MKELKEWQKAVLLIIFMIILSIVFALVLGYGEDIGWWTLPSPSNVTESLKHR